MKERYIPTKDLKTGAKVVGSVAEEVFKALKPTLEHEAARQIESILKLFKRNRI